MRVAEKCAARGIDEDALMKMVDDEAIAAFYGPEVFKLGVSWADMSVKFAEVLGVVLENSGSNPLGRAANEELQEAWPISCPAELYMGIVSAARVNQIAKSYGVTALAAYTLDTAYAGVLHPTKFRIRPMLDAAVEIEDGADAEPLPEWVQAMCQELQEEYGEDSEVRVVHYMDGCLLISLGGTSKSHLLKFYRQKIIDGGEPSRYWYQPAAKNGMPVLPARPPVCNIVGSFSKLATRAQNHGQMIYDPDEWGLAVEAQRGVKAGGSSAGWWGLLKPVPA
jgi:hypothetical protein